MLINTTRKFGVEIEFVGITRERAAEALTAAGILCYHEGYNHDTRNYWKVVHDGSVAPSAGMDYAASGELVSPPLSGESGIDQVRRALRAMVSAGARVNTSCGLHVHVDANDLSLSEIVNVVRRYAAFEEQINGFMPRSRRNGRWARSVAGVLPRLEEHLASETSLRSFRTDTSYWNRYYAVNVAAFGRHGTLEFRQHSGSVNASKVAYWIAFCVLFVEASRTTGMTATVSTAPARHAAAPSTARGRRPNYAARRIIVERLSRPEGATLADLSVASGLSVGTIQGATLGQLRGFGRVRLTRWNGVYRFTCSNDAGLAAWLGNVTVSAEVPPPPPPSQPVITAAHNDSLFRGMDGDIESFYAERAMELVSR